VTSNHTVRKARIAAERLFKESEQEPNAPLAAWTGDDNEPVSRKYFADGLTVHGRPGQCAGCGAWRTDGKPPTVHRTDCVYGPDGSRIAAVFDPSALQRKTAPTVNAPLTGARHSARNRR
jgi:hypothetical protein